MLCLMAKIEASILRVRAPSGKSLWISFLGPLSSRAETPLTETVTSW